MEDSQIIALFLARSEQAIGALQQKYGALCLSVARNILNNEDDAKECVNDAYLALWNAIPPATPDPLGAYVCKIVRNISIKRREALGAEKRCSTYDVALQELEEVLACPNTVEAEVELRQLTELIERFLGTLPAENRAIFLGRYWFSRSYQEIARSVGLKEKTVSVRLTRMRKDLRRYLKEQEVL